MFLWAVALGATEILLRSRSYDLPTSLLLDQRLSGNGDILALAYNCDQSVNAVGREACSSLGYRCYVPVLQASIGNKAKNGWTVFGWTVFDARLDVKTAFEYGREQGTNRKVYAIVHCLVALPPRRHCCTAMSKQADFVA